MARSDALREDAIRSFKAADALVEGSGAEAHVPAERKPAFDAHFADGNARMAEYREAAALEGNVMTVRDTLGQIAGAVRGSGPIPFRATELEVGAGRSWGQVFVESEAYAALRAGTVLTSDNARFRSDPVPVHGAATDVIQSTPSTGPGSALVTPQYLPGVAGLPQRPLTIRDLFAQGTTTSDSISYAQQTAFDNAAAPVAQATAANNGLKPQSSIAFTRRTSAVETIATWMAVTRQQLADAGQIRSIIDNQLRLMLALEEEDQLLNGNGTSPNLSGIYDQDGVLTLNLTGNTSNGDPNLDGLRNAMRLVRMGLSRATADFVVLHPTDSMEFDLLTAGDSGEYRIGDPYAYNANGQPRPIWGLRRVESEAIAEGSALVGSGRVGATVLERQGIVILTADQHADFFVRNLVVVLAEERLGFPVFFPSAFVDVTLAAWTEPS